VQRKSHKRKPAAKAEATSAFEAMEKMVQERKLSKKINYDVLKDLNPAAFKPDTADLPPPLQLSVTAALIHRFLHCFDAVGCATGRTSGLYKTEWWNAGVVIRVATRPGFPGMSRICAMLSRVPARPAPGRQMSRISR